jgi:cell division protein FtsL
MKKIMTRKEFSILVSFIVIFSLALVFFRMKGIEQDYQFSSLNSKIENELLENKDLRARRAKLLSVENLNSLSKKYSLSSPSDDQVIVIE